ncbi:MAG: FAD-binding oxidoreductase [Acidiferrobacteraceae bacterium]|jgi:FAD/FMN-containing dehydrogenase|nr:FAD-binding oxidoreductase [Acidiferrobacteraceae bacterium]MCP4829356.1 FAD-binding oxidoreductase [Pseudomonadota bacterium]MDP6951032.1 FAD-binding oxidoreductase [Arenicellales bacterium]HJP07837.1 FAD-binding oxidoreductase [Arenicellales bacterium]|tara:strand:+ start:1288 stop:2733 length:1446 start_codon:yes stop_codon:yes gene_type:complete
MEYSQLLKALQKITGPADVLFGSDDRSAYDRDCTGNYKGISLAVVRPANTDEVSRVIKLAHQEGLPIIPLSGNTGLAGGTHPGDNENSIIVSLERLNKIRSINPGARTTEVEAGVILQSLHRAVDEHDLVFPLLFGAKGTCLIGGNLATNAGGSNVLRYGNIRALCLGLEVVMPNGSIVNLMTALHKNNTGYDLKNLFIGAEGTLGIITAAVLKLFPKPKAYATAMISVSSIPAALELLNEIQLASGGSVEAFEYMPRDFFEHLAIIHPEMRPPFEQLPKIGVLVELGTTLARDAQPGPDGSIPIVSLLKEILANHFSTGKILDAVVAQSEDQRQEMWARREAAFDVVAYRPHAIDTDVAVPLDKVDSFVKTMDARLPEISDKAESACIAHLGDGNLHFSVWADPSGNQPHSPEVTDQIYNLIEDTVQELGGSFSAEHGIGLAKKATMARRKDPAALAIMRQIKSALDPKNIMNPGKVIPD